MGPHEATAATASSSAPPDPATVRTCEQLAQALKALAGTRGPQDIETAAAALKPPEKLARSTVSDMLRKGRPSEQTLAVFLRVCHVARQEHPAWMAARRRAAGHGREPELRQLVPLVRVADADPRDLGVHAAIDVPGADSDLPAYVERDTDTDPNGVRARIRRAVGGGRGQFLLLVGESSTGRPAAPARPSGSCCRTGGCCSRPRSSRFVRPRRTPALIWSCGWMSCRTTWAEAAGLPRIWCAH
ncbi:hypothetical protein AB0J35_51150 [Nonomuraea angiospora]|uniref:hypothetical protein n=1 Tax=Nonomuraea angiospora TaxID=46172 RepID=UPI00342E18A1